MMQANSYPLSESVFFRGRLSTGVLALAWTFLPSLAAGVDLYALSYLYDEDFGQQFMVLLVVMLALCVLIMQPNRDVAKQLTDRKAAIATELTIRWLILMFVLLLIGFITRSTPLFARRVLLTWATITPALIILVSFGLQNWMRKLTLDAANQRRVVFAGCNENSIFLARRIKANSTLCMSVAGFFDDRSTERLTPPKDINIVGNLRTLVTYARLNKVDVIFIALPIRHLPRVLDLLDKLRDTTASIYYVPDFFAVDLIQARTGDVLGVPVVAMCETPLYGLRGSSKRLFDITVSLIALVLSAPLLLSIAALVKLSSRGPVIFKQRRYGLDGAEINIYKFRTMTVVEDGADIRQATRNDLRVTRVGQFLRKSSLDELPQLINVLQGRMSLVGPRPHAVAHNEQYRKLIKGYMVRHKVLPGITGLAQINGCRGETKDIARMEARVQYDLEYLRHWSIFLDFKILATTLFRVFSDRNAY